MATFKELIEQNKPSLSIAREIAEKKSIKLTAKEDIINITNEESRKKFMEFLEKNNWAIQKEQIIFDKSYYGGDCIFITEINGEFQLGHSHKVINVGRNMADEEESITLLASMWKGNTSRYYLYETHTKERIVRSAIVADKGDGSTMTAKEAWDGSMKTPWNSFLIDTKINLKQEVITGIMTAFMLNNKKLSSSQTPLGTPDIELAQREIVLLDQAFESLMYTLRFNRSRLIIRRAAGAEIIGMDGDEELEGDEMLDGGVLIITDENGYEAGSPVSVFDPNPETIRNAFMSHDKAFEKVLTRVGLANPDDTDSAQKSKIEVSQIRDAEHSELERQIVLTQNVLKKLMIAIAKVLNIDLGEDFGWDIQRLDVRQETEILNNLKELYALGWITEEKAVAMANNISITEAKSVIEQVTKEKKEKVENSPLMPQKEPGVEPGQEPNPGVNNEPKTE